MDLIPRQLVALLAALLAACGVVTATAASAASDVPGWRSQPFPTVGAEPGVHNVRFADVACPTVTTCLAVGWFDDLQGRREPLSERFDGTDWQRVPLPSFDGVSTLLTAIGCSGPSFCLATGIDRVGSPANAHHNVAVAWSGSRWHPVPISGPGYGVLRSVACAGPSACFGTGPGKHAFPALWRRGARSWTRVHLPALPEFTIGNVSCGAPHDCVVAGTYADAGADHPVALHWNGHRWLRMRGGLPADGELTSVSCTAPGRCTAVGTVYVAGSHVEIPVAQVRTGATWHQESAAEYPSGGQGSGLLHDIACSTPTTCVAIGDGPARGSGPAPYIAARSADGTWTAATIASRDQIAGIACGSTCVAVGWARVGTQNVMGAIALAGTTATLAATTPVQPAGTDGGSLDRVSCAPGGTCAAIAAADSPPAGHTVVAVRIGGRWGSAQDGPSGHVVGVSCPSDGSCWAVGDDAQPRLHALVSHWDGSAWTTSILPRVPGTGSAQLLDVSCPTSGFCLAVGSAVSGTSPSQPFAERWDGTSWTPISAPATTRSARLTSVSCPSAQWCAATGSVTVSADQSEPLRAPLLVHWNGIGLVKDTGPASSAISTLLTDVSCAGRGMCMAVGSAVDREGNSSGLAYRWTGARWVSAGWQGSATSAQSVSCPTTTSCVTAGSGRPDTTVEPHPVIGRWNGSGWHRVTVSPGPPVQVLNDISCTAAGTCTAVGVTLRQDPVPLVLATG